MSLETLKKKLKEKNTVGLYYLYGEEEYLKSYYYEQLRKKTTAEMTEFNISEPSGDNLDLNILENMIDSFPMMSDRKFIGIVDLNHDLLTEHYKKQLLSALENLPEYLCMVFMDTARKGGKDAVLQRLVEKAGGESVEIEKPTTSALAAWGKKHFQSMGKEISNDDMQYILRIAENDMLSLKNEIAKIGSYTVGKTVTRKDIDTVITKSQESNRYALSDALAKRDFRFALKVIEDLYAQNFDDIQIVNLIYRCICDLLRASWAVSGSKSREQLAKDFGIHVYGAGKLMRASKSMTEKQLMQSAELCFKYEKRIKGESGDKREMIYELIGNLINCGSSL